MKIGKLLISLIIMTGKIKMPTRTSFLYDFLCEFTSKSECEGEQFLVEAHDMREVIDILTLRYDFAIGEFRILERMTVEEGEWLGLDTY